MLGTGLYFLGWHILLLRQQLGLFLSTVLKSEMLRVDWTRSHNEMREKKKKKKLKKIASAGVACLVSVMLFLAGAVRDESTAEVLLHCQQAAFFALI